MNSPVTETAAAGGPAVAAALGAKRSIGARVVIKGVNDGDDARPSRRAYPWVRGPFRRTSSKPLASGLVASVVLHVALAVLAAAVGIGSGVARPDRAIRDLHLTSVEVTLPRLASPPREPAAVVAPPAPAGPSMAPQSAPRPRTAARPAPPATPRPAPPTEVAKTAPPAPARPTGEAGRARAQSEVVKQLADVNGSLDRVLSDLSSSLGTTASRGARDAAAADTVARRRTIGGARTADQIGGVGDGIAGGARGGAGAIAGTGVEIAALLDRTVSSGAGGSGDGAGGLGEPGSRGGPGGAGDLRSNASLLATVRRYAPGIQFCYDNELKRTPGLRGKLVVGMTVAASGAVTEAEIVQDTIRSPSLAACTLAQVRGWRFPSIPAGDVAFKTPFVFTPPQ